MYKLIKWVTEFLFSFPVDKCAIDIRQVNGHETLSSTILTLDPLPCSCEKIIWRTGHEENSGYVLTTVTLGIISYYARRSVIWNLLGKTNSHPTRPKAKSLVGCELVVLDKSRICRARPTHISLGLCPRGIWVCLVRQISCCLSYNKLNYFNWPREYIST